MDEAKDDAGVRDIPQRRFPGPVKMWCDTRKGTRIESRARGRFTAPPRSTRARSDAMDRHLIGYLLIGFLIAAAAALVAFRMYHSRKRTLARQYRRTRAGHERRLALRDNVARSKDGDTASD